MNARRPGLLPELLAYLARDIRPVPAGVKDYRMAAVHPVKPPGLVLIAGDRDPVHGICQMLLMDDQPTQTPQAVIFSVAR